MGGQKLCVINLFAFVVTFCSFAYSIRVYEDVVNMAREYLSLKTGAAFFSTVKENCAENSFYNEPMKTAHKEAFTRNGRVKAKVRLNC